MTSKHLLKMHEARAKATVQRQRSEDAHAEGWLDLMRREAQAFSKRYLSATHREEWQQAWTVFSHAPLPTDAALRRVRGES